MRHRDPGFTLVEAVAVLAVVALLSLLVVAPRSGAELARETHRIAVGFWVARAEAIGRGRAVDVLGTCNGDAHVGVRSRMMTTLPHRGLVFTPDGLPRTCDGGGVGNTTILLEHRGRQAAVIVSSVGRVRWELR